MLFNSYEFIFVFLPITFFIYFFLLNRRLVVGEKGFLVFASLFFYSWWNIAYLPLILISMLFNYIVGNSLNGNTNSSKIKINKKSLLTFGIVANLSLLGYFKYANFFIENINYLSSNNVPTLDLALPLAISFFTFQQIAYLVDSYRKETSEYDFLNYALFVTFFPQLIAGPIVHHKEMMPQFASPWNLVKNYRNIAIGLFKKVVTFIFLYIKYQRIIKPWDASTIFKKDFVYSVFEKENISLLDLHEWKLDGCNVLDSLSRFDFNRYLPDDILTKVDRTTMAYSLEARVPILDHRVVEFAYSLPTNIRLQNGKKSILKDILYKHVPKKLIDRPKAGFSVPLKHWFRNELKDMLYAKIDNLDERFNKRNIQKLADLHVYKNRNYEYLLWNIMRVK